jgi:UDP-N-acetylglucosamine 1-carboxyvinyltransferase
MHKFVIEGGVALNGNVEASGSKNSALPILFASILSDKPLRLKRVPELRDIATTLELLRGIGARVSREGGSLEIEIPKLTSTEAPYELVRTMRASVLMLGPLLARAGQAKVSLPGGCAIGTRPVDLHLTGLEKMGAELKLEHGYIVGTCPDGRLKGAEITLRTPSVGATEHLMMAAALAEGRTVLRNSAREPEISDLARLLRAMGANVRGDGQSEILIDGASSLGGAEFEVMFDRIEAATLLLTGPMTGGSVRVERMDPSCLSSFLNLLEASGAVLERGTDWVRAAPGGAASGVNFVTEPYPGFPTDLQAQMMAYLAQVEGDSQISENIFENRFMHVPELIRLGASIRAEGAQAYVQGRPACYDGATVMATDLRASASLVLAGLAARGWTAVRRIYHLDRGYERMETKLGRLGARIRREAD